MTTNFDRPTILMCPPDFYGIEYEINPWMSRSRQSDAAASQAQWQALRSLIESVGAEVRLLDPVPGLPDLVFTANAGLVWGDVVFLASFRHEARQGETPIDDHWFREQGFRTIAVPERWDLKGREMRLFCGETLFAGYLIRSDAGAEQWLAKQMDRRVIPLQLVSDYYYHLDTCFCPIDAGSAIWFPPAFDDYGRQAIREHVPRLIDVVEEEAQRFACNAVVVGTHVVHNTGCPQLERSLQDIGFTPHATELGEFIKAGGSAKCLTLRLDGEDAAIWNAGRR